MRDFSYLEQQFSGSRPEVSGGMDGTRYLMVELGLLVGRVRAFTLSVSPA